MLYAPPVAAAPVRVDAPPNSGPALRFGDLTLDPRTRDVRRGDREIQLTPLEFTLLHLFLSHPRHVLTRSFIFTRVWGFDFGAMSNSLNVYVGYLRRKIERDGEYRLIHTVRGVGYVLREP
ncbi:MAG TPA: winged helix-turn-helix domain-containing protein [Gaiellaceae bacterium]